jgi:WD40 repeat protein
VTSRGQIALRLAALSIAIVGATAFGIWLATERDTSHPTGTPSATSRQASIEPPSRLPSSFGRAKVTAAALNGRGAVALATSAGSVRLIRPGTQAVDRHVVSGRRIIDLTVSDDNSTVAGFAGIEDPALIWIWHVSTNKLEFADAPYAAAVVALTGNGARLAAGGFDIDVYNLVTGNRIGAIRPKPRPGGSSAYEAIVFGPQGGMLAAAAVEGVDLWNVHTGLRRRPALNCPSCGADGVALSKDGRFVAYGTADGHVLLWDVNTKRIVLDKTVSPRGDHVYGVAVTPDGSRVAAGTSAGLVVTYDTRTGGEIERAHPSAQAQAVVALSMSDDGHTLLVQEQLNRADYEIGEEDRWLVHVP